MVYTSYLTSFRTTEDIGSYEIRKYQENFKTVQDDSPVPSPPVEKENFVKTSKNLLKNRH